MTDGPELYPDAALTARVDRFAAGLCLLVATVLVAASAAGVVDFVRDCAWFPHVCFYVAFASPILVGGALVAGFAGYWFWTRKR